VSARTFADAEAVQAAIGGFFRRLTALEPLVRQLTGDEAMIVLVELERPPLEMAIDLSVRPMQVRDSIVIGRGAPNRIGVTAEADVMHQLLLGRLGAARAIRQRRLLLRGSMALVARFLPLLDLSASLYPDHLRSVRYGAPVGASPRRAIAPEGDRARSLSASHGGSWMSRSNPARPAVAGATAASLAGARWAPSRVIDAMQHPTVQRATRRALRAVARRAGRLIGRLQVVDPELSLFELLRAFGEGVVQEREMRAKDGTRQGSP
jgi:hypothetical protein